MNNIKTFFVFCLLFLLLPIGLTILIVAIPILALGILIDTQVHRLKLSKLKKENNGRIYFLYADYNKFDFNPYFKNHQDNIVCVSMSRIANNDLFMDYLSRQHPRNKCFPRLVKIDGKNVITKEHYNSFKSLVKRNNDSNAFFDLIERSIQNLKK